jgi:fructokinase
MMRIGVDLGGTKIEIVALDDHGTAVIRRRTPTPSADYAATVRAIVDLVVQAQKEIGDVATVGIATPGAILGTTGLIKNSNSTVLNGRPLLRDIAAALGQPVRIENDANCLAISEAADGAAAGAKVVFGAILGTGVGGGLVVNGRVVTGSNRIAGEWGHNPLPWAKDSERPGQRCYCGKSGCIETFLSGAGLARDYFGRSRRTRAPQDIVAAAATGADEDAVSAISAYKDRLARGLASIINVVDPDVVVLGGGLSNIDALYSGLADLIAAFAFSDDINTKIVKAMHGDSSGVRGAAWLWPPKKDAQTGD